MIFRFHEWKQRQCTTKARFAESNSTVTKSGSFWVAHNSVYVTQYRWQTTPHFQYRWDRVFLLIRFLRKLSPREELIMWSSPMSQGVRERTWPLLQAAVQVVHLFPLSYCQGVWMYKQDLPAGTEISLTILFLNWFNTFRNAGLEVVLDESSSRAFLTCMNYRKESDIKLSCLLPHTLHMFYVLSTELCPSHSRQTVIKKQ